MKKIIPILLIGMFVLGGLEAGALSEIKENTLMEKKKQKSLLYPIQLLLKLTNIVR